MKLAGWLKLLWVGLTVAYTSHREGFKAQADASKGPAFKSTARKASVAADDDYTCNQNKKCSIGCCGPL